MLSLITSRRRGMIMAMVLGALLAMAACPVEAAWMQDAKLLAGDAAGGRLLRQLRLALGHDGPRGGRI